MLALRKILPVLAVLALIAIPASAQQAGTAFQCSAAAGAPPLVRGEGLAEPVGDLVLTCSGGDPSNVLNVNVRILLTTNITSNLLGTTQTESVLAIDDPVNPANWDPTKPNAPQCASTTCSGTGYTAYLTAKGLTSEPQNMWLGNAASFNQIEWLGIPITPPGSTGQRVIRITNVRADATAVTTGGFLPGSISMYISITGSTSVPVSPQPQTVAFVIPGLKTTVSAGSFKQCTAPSSIPTITFTELFATAFRKKINQSWNGTTLATQAADQSTLGGSYFTESMFTNSAVTGLGAAGVANQGTRFIIRLKNINNGAAIAVPGSVTSSASALVAKFVSGAASDGSGGTVDASGGTLTQSSGQAYAVYEVTGDATATSSGATGYNVTDSFTISLTPSWTVSIGTNVPGLGSATVNGSFAPINTTNVMSATAPEPRFKDTGVDTTFMTVSACRTILLFPFLTNQAGFDTGVAIINTSNDPFSGTGLNQSGACTLYYYGDAAPAAVPTPAINAGEHMALTLSGGGNVIGRPTATVAGAPGFQGYMFAICLFQYARGYAFITKQGATDIAHGYLALIVPDRTRVAAAFSMGAAVNEGEQLVF